MTTTSRITQEQEQAVAVLQQYVGGEIDNRLLSIARRLERLAVKLRTQVRPGHVEYISKADAAACIDGIISDLL